MSGFLYADDLVLCGESEDYLRVMVGYFVEVRKRMGLKVIVDESMMMMLGREYKSSTVM